MPFQLEHSKHGGLYFENTAALWGPKSHLRTNDLWVLLFLFISCATGFNAVANSLPRGQSKWELHPLQGGMPLGIPRAWGASGVPAFEGNQAPDGSHLLLRPKGDTVCAMLPFRNKARGASASW